MQVCILNFAKPQRVRPVSVGVFLIQLPFSFERGTLLISRSYIEKIQRLENDPDLCLKKHTA